MSLTIYVVLLLLSYCIGSFPTGYVLTRYIKKINLLKYGSGNTGATNVYRALGFKWAALVGGIDIAKGALPVLAGRALYGNELLIVILGLVAVAGHNWSIFLRFKGGRGVATSAGVLLTLMPIPTLLAGLIWYGVMKISRYVSLGSIMASASFPILVFFLEDSRVYLVFTLFMAAISIFQHRSNIMRLVAGKENRI